jgi:hypothetical protein
VYGIDPHIPYLKRFAIFLVGTVRMMFFYCFALRVMVVYVQWKKDEAEERKKRFSIWKYFFDEKFSIKVNLLRLLFRL